MSGHPENSPEINELMAEVAKTETAPAWCLGCNDWTVVNAAYSKYIKGEVSSCGRCRQS